MAGYAPVQHYRTLRHQNERAFLVGNVVQCNTIAHVRYSLVVVSHAVTMLASTYGFHVQTLIQFGVTNMSNAQLAEEIAATLQLLKLLFGFRVCRSEVTTLDKGSCFFLMALSVDIFFSISTLLPHFEYCSFPRRCIEGSACTTVSFMQSWLSKVSHSMDELTE